MTKANDIAAFIAGFMKKNPTIVVSCFVDLSTGKISAEDKETMDELMKVSVDPANWDADVGARNTYGPPDIHPGIPWSKEIDTIMDRLRGTAREKYLDDIVAEMNRGIFRDGTYEIFEPSKPILRMGYDPNPTRHLSGIADVHTAHLVPTEGEIEFIVWEMKDGTFHLGPNVGG